MPIHHRLLTAGLLALLLLGLPGPAFSHLPEPPGPPEWPDYASLAAPQPAAAQAYAFSCGYSADISQQLSQTSAEAWTGWISRLSGATPVTVGGQVTVLTSRHSPRLFDGRSKAYDYLKEQVLALYPAEQVEEHAYLTATGATWKNLIVTLPGTRRPEETVILSAHFDSVPPIGEFAPGADDNASGSASLLEAARILRGAQFDRTIRLVWFTGEEQGLWGSLAYTRPESNQITDASKVVGVINLDMFAYDGDQDRCFELHIGTLETSRAVGQCMADAIQAYDLNLTYDFFDNGNATTRSDHSSFWRRGIGAIEVSENFFPPYASMPGGCPKADPNPYYHTVNDTLDKINVSTGFDIHRAALAALMSMAQPSLEYQYFFPMISLLTFP